MPSFVFIITGAPLIDRIRHTGSFANALNGITIAVVGVIGGLAVFVARHALFVDGSLDWVITARDGRLHRRLAVPRRRHHRSSSPAPPSALIASAHHLSVLR